MMPEAKRILLIGAGGHCMSVLDSLISTNEYDEIGIVDKRFVSKEVPDNINKKTNIMGIPIVGTDEEIYKLYLDGYSHAFITVGSVGDVTIRKQLYQLVIDIGYLIPNIIDKSAIVSQFSELGHGNFIGKNAIINSNCKVGNCTIINTASVVEHESVIEDYVHVAPGSVLCGKVHIGRETHIGAGSVVKQGIQVGTNTLIGAGSVVVKNIGSNIIAYGNPCKEV